MKIITAPADGCMSSLGSCSRLGICGGHMVDNQTAYLRSIKDIDLVYGYCMLALCLYY